MNKLQLLLISAVLGLTACASGGIATNAPDFQNKFASGNLRLTCGLACVGTMVSARQKEAGLFNNKLWMDLAKEAAGVGYDSDQQYFYLGASAAALGYRNAARTYFTLANASPIKCSAANACDGLSFPRDTNAWINWLNQLDAKDAAAAKAKSNTASTSTVNSNTTSTSTANKPAAQQAAPAQIEAPKMTIIAPTAAPAAAPAKGSVKSGDLL